MAAVAPQALANEDPASRPLGREVPKLSLVTPDYEPNGPNWPEPASKVTQQIPEIAGPQQDATAKTAAQRISAARKAAARKSLLSSNTGRLLAALLALLVIVGAGGGYLMLKGKTGAPAVVSLTVTPAPTKPAPTPTGLGDATNTPIATSTPKPPPSNVIGINGWVQVNSGAGLTLRDAATRTGKRLGVLPGGTKAHVVDGPKTADGYTWWKVDRYDAKNPTASGWVAGQFLSPIPAP